MEMARSATGLVELEEWPVPRRLRVQLNLPLLIANLSRDEGREMREEEVLQWLSDAGFSRQDHSYWIVAESDLGQVDPSEVLEAQPLSEN